MSEWVACHVTPPPVDMSVLLYVVTYHKNSKFIYDESIIVGFHNGEENADDKNPIGYYTESYTGIITAKCISLKYVFVEENDTLKVIAWTLLPRKPYKEILENEDWSG